LMPKAATVVKDGEQSAEKDGSHGKTIKPDPPPVAHGVSLSPLALVSRPPAIAGAQGWTIETRFHRGLVTAVAYSKDCKRLASGGLDGTVRLWEPVSGQLLKVLVGHADKVSCLAWAPDNKTLASAGPDHTVRLWDADHGKLLHTLAEHSGPIQ